MTFREHPLELPQLRGVRFPLHRGVLQVRVAEQELVGSAITVIT